MPQKFVWTIDAVLTIVGSFSQCMQFNFAFALQNRNIEK